MIFKRKRFPFYRQHDAVDCGPTCLRMIARYYGKSYSLQALREKAYIGHDGVSALGLREAANTIGMHSLAVRVPHDKLDMLPLPYIAHWKENHFVVVHKVHNNKIHVADPAHGLLTYSREEFVQDWVGENGKEGVLIVFEPAADFNHRQDDEPLHKATFRLLWGYLTDHKQALLWVILLMVIISFVQIVLPFLTKLIVDKGIGRRDVPLLYLILTGQLVLYSGRTLAEFARRRILLHVGTRVNISLVADFLEKLMKLPLSFFDGKMLGDLLQRVNDHSRIEVFLTNALLQAVFLVINLLAFSVALAVFSPRIFAVFVIGSAIYATYFLFFLSRRQELDYKRFTQLSENQSTLVQLIRGMPEIKLNADEKRKRQEWQQIQEKLYQVNIASLTLNQYQQGGASFINELKNLMIVFLAATSVISGDITLGSMLAIQFIVGQLNTPVTQLLDFAHTTQDAKISLERLGEVHQAQDEDAGRKRICILPAARSLSLVNVSFRYGGPDAQPVLIDLNLHIPVGKVTAVVGPSGSGKTTLLKLLLKFYEPARGTIQLGDMDLLALDSHFWRQQCGVVMQDGYIFSDTVANNIAFGTTDLDETRLLHALETANLRSFIESLPSGYRTKIGHDGHGLSRGQKQRILIARAIYKNPDYLFFDEATNALDASNEKTIVENLARFFAGKTVFIIAHRLSTVKEADQIVVLDKGQIVEQGTHAGLIHKRSAYYHLVKDQLELGA